MTKFDTCQVDCLEEKNNNFKRMMSSEAGAVLSAECVASAVEDDSGTRNGPPRRRCDSDTSAHVVFGSRGDSTRSNANNKERTASAATRRPAGDRQHAPLERSRSDVSAIVVRSPAGSRPPTPTGSGRSILVGGPGHARQLPRRRNSLKLPLEPAEYPVS
jgi:hypothetical protein